MLKHFVKFAEVNSAKRAVLAVECRQAFHSACVRCLCYGVRQNYENS